MRLLVIDDERGVSAFISFVARERGWAVDTAVDEAEFHRHFEANCPDAIMLDLQLGGADGIEQLRFLSQRHFAGDIVLISGFDKRTLASAQQRGTSLDLSIVAAETKPLRLDRTRALLDQLKERMEAKDEAPANSPCGIPAAHIGIDSAMIGEAIRAGQMELFLQPIMKAADGALLKYEALIRWRHPERGMVPPDQFIPIAERDETVIDELTAWVITKAGAHHHRLTEMGHGATISVNLSGANLHRLDFPDRVAALVLGAGIPVSALSFEVTETVATRDLGDAIDILTRLRLKGFGLAIDDFGMGYSSLETLRRLPFSEVKIDKSFVSEALSSYESLAIVRSILQLARSLELSSVAEGVETAQMADLLTGLGVHGLQGYHFAPALPFDRLVEWLQEQPRTLLRQQRSV